MSRYVVAVQMGEQNIIDIRAVECRFSQLQTGTVIRHLSSRILSPIVSAVACGSLAVLLSKEGPPLVPSKTMLIS